MNNFGRKIKITIGEVTFTNDELEVRFEVPFDDDPKPNESKIQIYNLSQDTISKIKKGDSVTVQAGYGTDIGVITIGKLSRVLTKMEGVNKITSIYSIEGDDFTRIKVNVKNADKDTIRYHQKGVFKGQVVEGALGIGFKPGTKASTIINRLVEVLGIKLAHKPILVRDKEYKKGYLVTQLIMNNLEEVIKDCGSAIYHRRGKLVIRPITEGLDENFILEERTGLIQSPGQFEEDDVKGYSVRCLLQHRITTASIITIKSQTANGKYRAKRGKHIADADDFKTEFQVI
jgi:hypothetical protein